MFGFAWERCVFMWADLTSSTPLAYIVSPTWTYDWIFCDTPFSILSLWSTLSRTLFYLKILYGQGLSHASHFENRTFGQSLSQHPICLKSLLSRPCASHGYCSAPFESEALARLVVDWECESPTPSTTSRPDRRSTTPQVSVTCRPLRLGHHLCLFLFGAIGNRCALCFASAPQFISPPVVASFLVSHPAQSKSQNPNNSVSSALVPLTAVCTSKTEFAEERQISGPTNSAALALAHLVPRHDSNPADPRWRAMVIGGTIGSTAGAAILGTGIYLLYRARRKQRATTTRTLPTIESQSTELQAPGSLSVPDDAAFQPRFPRDAPGTSSLGALDLKPNSARSTSPQPSKDITRITYVRASTGSQFREHFDDPRTTHGRILHEAADGENFLPPVPVPDDIERGSTPSQAGPSTWRSSLPPSSSSPTWTNVAGLPPSTSAPVGSVGNYRPAEASTSKSESTSRS